MVCRPRQIELVKGQAPAFRRTLWQVTQYLSSTARGTAALAAGTALATARRD
jgi:hypothetical protein